MACELTNGRLTAECKSGMAGIKTIFFMKYNDVVPVIEVDGSVSGFGTVSAFRFEQGSSLGQAVETTVTTEESGVSFVEQVITLSLLAITQADLADLNALKKGRFVIMAMDYENNARVFGVFNGATANGGDSGSGLAPADAKVFNMTFIGRENDYAPFTEPPAAPSTPYNPFEDMVDVTVTPAY